MSTVDKNKQQKKTSETPKKQAEEKKLSQFGRAMRKYRGWGEIVDMRAVLK